MLSGGFVCGPSTAASAPAQTERNVIASASRVDGDLGRSLELAWTEAGNALLAERVLGLVAIVRFINHALSESVI